MKHRVQFLALAGTLLITVVSAHSNEPTVVQSIDVAPAWSGHSVGYCLLTDGGRQYVAYYDAKRQMTVAARVLTSREWAQVVLQERVNWDSHHYITMALDQTGRLHVSGNMHGDPLVYFRMTKPHDIATLQRLETMVGRDEESCTYPQFMRDKSGNLLFLYRSGKSGDGFQLVNRYDDTAGKWYRLLDTPLFDGLGKASCYPEGPVLGPDGYFHLVWVWRESGDCKTNFNLCYARTGDFQHWETADGKKIPLPITPESQDTIVDPVPIEGGMINETTVVGFDGQGRTIVSYHKFDAKGNTQIYNARFEGGRWVIHQTSDWDYRWFFSGGGTIEVDVDVGPVTVLGNGELRQGFKHVKHGEGMWCLDEGTLKPLVVQNAGTQLLGYEDVPTSQYPDMQVRWKGDEYRTAGSAREFFLRWEAPPVTRDRERAVVPKPVLLRVLEVQHPECFDLGTSCIHDGYF